MANKSELEERIVRLEKELDEMRTAIRNLAQQNLSVLDSVSKINEEILKVKTDINKVKNLSAPKTMHDNSITKYE